MKAILLTLVVLSGVAFGFDPRANSLSKRQALTRALAGTQSWLKVHKLEAPWREYLQWDALDAQLAKSDPDLEALKDLLNLWRKNNVGLDDPHFVTSQRALREFIRAEEIRQEGDFPKSLEARRVELAYLLASTPDAKALERIGHLLGWLEMTGQDASVVRATRARWAYPNLQLNVSSRLVAYGTDGTKVNKDEYATATILGMVVSGQSHVEGTVAAVPIASATPGYGIIELQFRAKVTSPHNYGVKGPVGIHSSSYSNALVTKKLYFGPSGITAGRAQYSVDTHSKITQIDARGPIIWRIANRKAQRKQGQANAEAEAITGTKLASEFDQQVDAQIRKGQQEQAAKVKRTLEFEGTMPKLAFGSSNGGLVMTANEANGFQLSAPSAAPRPTAGMDLNAAVHESFTGNFMEPYLGNKTEWDFTWYDIHKLLTMDEPRALRVHDRTPRWYFRVVEESPMVTRFRDGVIRFEMRGKETGWGDLKATRPVEVHVAYHPVIEGGEAMGRREGEVEVFYTTDETESDTDAQLKKVIHEKMSAFFPERFRLGGLSIPKGSGWDKFDNLKPQRIEARNGWLVSDYKLVF